MDTLIALVEEMEKDMGMITSELQDAKDSGKFSYARSKNIRMAAMELIKKAKGLRVDSLEYFKENKKNK